MDEKLNIPMSFVICAVIGVVCFFAGAWMADKRNERVNEFIISANDYKRELICAYEQYYQATESFLDTLEVHYNWVDAWDYEPYYMAVERLDTLYKYEEWN